jgi:hypothetical protein
MYWSLTTMTTVGYGDVTPNTQAGRIVAVAVMLVGIGFVAIVTGAVAQRFNAPAETEAQMSRDEPQARPPGRTTRPHRNDAHESTVAPRRVSHSHFALVIAWEAAATTTLT